MKEGKKKTEKGEERIKKHTHNHSVRHKIRHTKSKKGVRGNETDLSRLLLDRCNDFKVLAFQ